MRRNNNRTIIFLVLLVLLVIGVGYAYLTSNLSITGATSVAGNTWDIHFENVVESSDNTITPTIAPVANPQNKVTDLTYSIRFDKPGDVYEFNVDVVNAGTIDAMIETFTSKIKIGDGELQVVNNDTLPSYLKYYIKYADGVNIKENHLLYAADRETITIHVEFKEDITESDLEDSADETILLDIDIKYVQATEEGEEKPTRLNCTYEGDLVNNAEYVNGQYTYRYNSSTDGWSASITDRNSTDPVTTPLCSTINEKPIKDMNGMFAISKATSIDLSSFDTSHVTNMSSMFYDAEVEELDVSSFNTENVTNMSRMFSGTSITSIDISNFDMQNVISMSYMFDSTAIERLDMSNLNIKNVQSMEYLCTKCTNLKYINLNNGGSDKLTGFFDVLYNADNVEEIHMKNFNFGTVSNLGTTSGMFYNKQKLKVVDLNGAKMSNIDSAYNAFYNCKELEELNLSNIYAPKTQLYAYRMFYDNLKLNSLDISSFDFSQLNTNTNAGMFTNVPATTVYVKDQANVDALNALSDKPSTITFVIKS